MTLAASPAIAIEFDAGVWTDVSSLCRAASWKRGRSHESETFTAGRASVVLSNADRLFDPEYASGIYFGKLLPRKRIRIGFTYAATTYWKFYGFTDGWPQSYDGPNDSTVTVWATDAFKVFARAVVPSAWEIEVRADSPSHWFDLGEQDGTIGADGIAKLHGEYVGGATFFSRTGLIAKSSNNAIAFSDGVGCTLPAKVFPSLREGNYDATVEFWITCEDPVTPSVEHHVLFSGPPDLDDHKFRIWVADGIVWCNFSHGTGTPRSLIYSGTTRVDDGQSHHVAVTLDTGVSHLLYVDGVDRTTVSGSQFIHLELANDWPTYINNVPDETGITATLDDFVFYPSTLSAARVLAHYNAGATPYDEETPKARIDRVLDYIGWPIGDRDIDTGSAVLVPATLETNALAHFQDVEVTEGGRFFVDRTGRATLIGRSDFLSEAVYKTSNATFGDAGAELRYQASSGELFGFDDETIINEARVRQFGGSEQVETDATSVDAYGLMARSESSLDARPGVVRNRAEYLVNRYKDPLIRMPIVNIQPEGDPVNIYPIVGVADLGYRYTFVRRPQGVGSAISKDFHLEGEAGSMTPGTVDIAWELSPAETAFWVWGTSTWETGDSVARWGY